MEENLDQSISTSNDLEITKSAQLLLLSAAKWAKFIAIVIAVISAVYFLFSLYALIISRGFLFVPFFFILITLLIYFAYFIFNYRFGANMKKALEKQDKRMFTNACENLKNIFAFQGILILIGIGFFVIAFLIGGLSAIL